MIAVPLPQLSNHELVAELRGRGRGWRCDLDDETDFVTPGVFSARHRFGRTYFTNLLRRGTKPPGLEEHRSQATGRLLFVRGTAEADALAARAAGRCAVSDYAAKLKDPRWQRRRVEVMQRDNFTCRDCRDAESPLHVHHCPYEKGEPWKMDATFLLTLCESCHESRQKLEQSIKRDLG